MSALVAVLSLIGFIAVAVWLSVSLSRRDDGRLRLLEAARGQAAHPGKPGGHRFHTVI